MKSSRGLAWTPENIPWGDPAADGTKYALLEGRRDVKGGLFTYAFFIPAGFWDAAHWHSHDARVFVLSGTLCLEYGNKLEAERATRYEAGSFLLVPADSRHFDGSDVDTVIVGVASGVWVTRYVDSSVVPSAGTIS
jgi:uncharacterized RmlC-like cupin family protein